ncbi:hypothetical protein AJ87_07210 [Rhizobium yanglingense]|nr:hypothetical protein AJ87_07210 [Rhizobium yanglingense]
MRTAERLVRLIAAFCILAWRVVWMTMLNRTMPDARPELAITAVEMRLLDQLIANKPVYSNQPKTLSSYLPSNTSHSQLGNINSDKASR